jgi:hypothetical protein
MTLAFWIMFALWLVTFVMFVATARYADRTIALTKEAIAIADDVIEKSRQRDLKVQAMLDEIDDVVGEPPK